MTHLPTPYHISYGAHLSIVEREVAKAVKLEQAQTRRRMWIAFACSTSIALAVGATVRRQPWFDLPWQATPLISVSVLYICYWLGDRMFHKGLKR